MNDDMAKEAEDVLEQNQRGLDFLRALDPSKPTMISDALAEAERLAEHRRLSAPLEGE